MLGLRDLIRFTDNRLSRFHEEDARTLWSWLVTHNDAAELEVRLGDGRRQLSHRDVMRLADSKKSGLVIETASLARFCRGLKELRGSGLDSLPPRYLGAVQGTTVNGRSLLADWAVSLPGSGVLPGRRTQR
jgi:hypothetical protein